ncbi:hypothetical protein GCM10008955_29630 [Deinococcus malanensis]|uniref:HD-GYP domain-containing protein n=1 Tax=Deinococcus malanensis TaxID=1706855 RepID=A0ABQ2EZA6_9DEIO|nr:hypothetical protein GCM10008955_29630 [Deinococcus malanensis]
MCDALTGERPCRPAWTQAQEVSELTAQCGRQFNAAVVNGFACVITSGLHTEASRESADAGTAGFSPLARVPRPYIGQGQKINTTRIPNAA